MFLVGRFW